MLNITELEIPVHYFHSGSRSFGSRSKNETEYEITSFFLIFKIYFRHLHLKIRNCRNKYLNNEIKFMIFFRFKLKHT